MSQEKKAVQIIAFPKDFFLEDPASLYVKITEASFISSSKSQIIPVPPDVQREIPRMIIVWETKPYQIAISFDRIDFQCQTDLPIATIIGDAKLFFDLLQEHHNGMKYKRVGFVLGLQLDKEAGGSMLELLASKNLLPKVADFNFKVTFDDSEDYFESNRTNQIVNIQAPNVQEGVASSVNVTFDFNTHQSLNCDWSKEKLHEFIKHAGDRMTMDHIKQLITV